MATFDYAASAELATRLLTQFGQTVTLTKTIPGTYNPVTGTSTGDTTATQTCMAVLLGYNLHESGARYAEGTMIRVGDKKCLIEAEGLAWGPDEATKLTDATGQAWQLEVVRTLAPAGTPPVLYTANATR
jgi:hypothetical protein